MIQLEEISIQFGGRYLFHEVSFVIKSKDRIGLVGKNGAGKSTLLKTLMGEINPDEGQITKSGGLTIGYLPQEMHIDYHRNVYEETATAFEEIQSLRQLVANYENQLNTATEYESPEYTQLLERYSEASDRLQNLGGHNLEATIEKVLKGLGFMNGDFTRAVTEFSGGWQMRIELAKILLRQPDFILLDEPTNHLDIESIMWLEQFLKTYPGGVVIISHDQRFLDNATNKTVEIVQGKIYSYSVPYTKFLNMREQRVEKQKSEKLSQDKWIANTKVLIEKFRAKKNKAKFAQTLIRKLERVEPIVIDDMEKGKINFHFPPAPRSGKVVVKTEGIRKDYGSLNVLKSVDFLLERGEKIAFVGKNGEGKSTFSKIIGSKIESSGGELEIGYNVKIGYFEQHQAESLDGNLTVFQTIDDVATGEMRTKVRSLLGAFLFSGEDADKKVMVLSGGEKSRLALAKLLLDPINLLILDEPTNHLDIRSKEILKAAIRNFEGAVIVVSHDREFLKGLTDRVYEFHDKNLHLHYGDVYDFLEKKKVTHLDDLGMTTNTNVVEKKVKETAIDKKERNQQLRELGKQIKSLNNKTGKIEKKIAELETAIEGHEKMMADPDFYMKNAKSDEIMKEYQNNQKTLEEKMEEWESVAEELDIANTKKATLE